MVLVQNWSFFPFFFLASIGQETVFYDSLERKNAFLGYKNKKLKNSKNWHFSNPWSWSKNGHFGKFFFSGNIVQENVLYDILEGQNAFLGCKNKKFKKSKNWDFFKGVSAWFSAKIGYFWTKIMSWPLRKNCNFWTFWASFFIA